MALAVVDEFWIHWFIRMAKWQSPIYHFCICWLTLSGISFLHLLFAATAAAAKSLQSCPTLCDPIDGSPPGSPVPGILQARTLEWVAISFSNACKHAKSLQSCPTLCDLIGSSPPGSSVHGILQARILEWGAIAFSIYCVVILKHGPCWTNRINT